MLRGRGVLAGSISGPAPHHRPCSPRMRGTGSTRTEPVFGASRDHQSDSVARHCLPLPVLGAIATLARGTGGRGRLSGHVPHPKLTEPERRRLLLNHGQRIATHAKSELTSDMTPQATVSAPEGLATSAIATNSRFRYITNASPTDLNDGRGGCKARQPGSDRTGWRSRI